MILIKPKSVTEAKLHFLALFKFWKQTQ